jgi:hypothetical protein
MVLTALSRAGGVEYLLKQSKDNPTAFLTLIGKLIPIDVDITKTQINVVVGLYPEEAHEQHKPIAAQEAAESIH